MTNPLPPSYLMGKNYEFPLRLGTRWKCPFSPLFFNIEQATAIRTGRNKRHPNGKGRSKAVIIWRWHDIVHREPKDCTKKLLELISKFSKVAGYKINIQKSVAFYIPIMKYQREKKLFKCFQNCSNKIKYRGINLTKFIKDLYLEDYETLKKKLKKIQVSGSTYRVHG